MIHTTELADKLKSLLSKESETYEVAVGMRYGQPSVDSALDELHEKGCRKIIVIPMYPQYSGSTTGSIMDAIGTSFKKRRWVPELRFINAYHTHPKYIQALAQSVEQHWQENGRAEKLILSFHGIPQRYVRNGDPYQHHCEETTQLVVNALGLSESEYQLVYQSRVGREPWLQPYCDETMKSLPQQGVKSIDVICPGFSADCLETIEEIDQENREYFIEAGGENYHYIPCLNSNDHHVALLNDLISS